MSETQHQDLQSVLDSVAPNGDVIHLGGGDYAASDLQMPPCPVEIDATGARFVGAGGTAIVPHPEGELTLRGITFEGYDTAVELPPGDHRGLTVENCTFRTEYAGIDGNEADELADATVQGCEFDGMAYGVRTRGTATRRFTFERNHVHDVWYRGVILGPGADNRITRCTFEDLTADDQHVIGVLSYGQTDVTDTSFRNVHSPDRAEAVSLRGDGTTVRGCTFRDAGGDTGAISLATPGSMTIADCRIDFSAEWEGSRHGIDVRKSRLWCVDNDLTGWEYGVRLRRGGTATIRGNCFRASTHARTAMHVGMATGEEIPDYRMGRVTVTGNQVYNVDTEHDFAAVNVRPRSHGGAADPRLDDLVITDNLVTDVTAPTARGVQFQDLYQADSHAARVVIANNDLDVPNEQVYGFSDTTDSVFADNVP